MAQPTRTGVRFPPRSPSHVPNAPPGWWARNRRFQPRLGFFLGLAAVGALIIEGAVGVGFYAYGIGHPTSGPAEATVPVPAGVPIQFELKAFLTGYIGVGGTINGLRNPTLTVGWGDTVTITLVDGENMTHNLHVDGANVQTSYVGTTGATTTLGFKAATEGTFAYYCTMPGHRQAGMAGSLIVGEPTGPQIGPELPLTVPRIAHDPTAIPPPLNRTAPETVNIYLHAVEVTAEIEPGVSYQYWTYNATVPGPFFRVMVGDTVVVHFTNDATSTMSHSVDFHAVTGPGGGAAVTQTPPGGENNFTFLAMIPGLYVYHCGTPNIPTHIANGMFGMILVEPLGGLPAVTHEYYLMESEFYVQWSIHTLGNQLFNGTALTQNQPTYVVFNGAFDTLTGSHALRVAVNDSVRIFFGEAGPNDFSAFHMIGAMFDTVWPAGDYLDPPQHGLQTVAVAPGSTMTTDFTAMYPGNYSLVDHQIANAIDEGALAVLNVTGWANSSIFHRGATTAVSIAAGPASLPAAARRAES